MIIEFPEQRKQGILIDLERLRELMARFIAESDGDLECQLTLSQFLVWLRKQTNDKP